MKSRGIALLCGLALCLGNSAHAEASSRIVFAHGSGLDFISPTGSELGRIKHFGSSISLSASDNGRYVVGLPEPGAFFGVRCHYSALVHTAGGPKRRRVEIGVGWCETHPAPSLAISPDGHLLAFSSGLRIRVINLATGRRWTLRKPDGIDFQPSFSSDGRHLVFVHSDSPSPFLRHSDIYMIEIDGGSVHRLTDSPGERELFPELSPDGSHLAFLRRDPHVLLGHPHGYELVVKRVGSDQEQLIRRVDCLFSRPDFSPDGRQLVYAWGKTDQCLITPRLTIFTVGIDGRGNRAIARDIPRGESLVLPQWTRVPSG